MTPAQVDSPAPDPIAPVDRRALDAWLDFRRRGERAALLTLVRIDGSAPRPIGSHIAVSETGVAFGYITGGCAEAALAAEAVEALQEGGSRLRRYGQGSPYIDVKLPCGSGVDIHFAVDAPDEVIETAAARLAARRTAALAFDLKTGAVSLATDGAATGFGPAGDVFIRAYAPLIRVEIIGKGPVTPALARLASAAGFDVGVISPEDETLALCRPFAARARALATPGDYSAADVDRWTAAAVVFHEHDWDPPAISTLLKSDAFYVGALGSRKTHAARIEQLNAIGVPAHEIARIAAPIGVDIGAVAPEEIAVATLAEIVKAARFSRCGARWSR